jgi:sulfate transport system ATP-binding protein
VSRSETPASDEALAFVRPHDIEVVRDAAPGALAARVLHVQAIGPLVRVEVEHQSEIFEVELGRQRQIQLDLKEGDAVWLRPRNLRVFQGEQMVSSQTFDLGAGI